MKVESYAFGAIAIVSGIVSVIAFIFFRMHFVGEGPLCLALFLLASGIIGFVTSLPRDRKKAKKERKPKKNKKAAEEAEAE